MDFQFLKTSLDNLYINGMLESINQLVGVYSNPPVFISIYRAKALMKLGDFTGASSFLEELSSIHEEISDEDMDTIIDLRLSCYLKTRKTEKIGPYLAELETRKKISTRQNFLIAKAYFLINRNRINNHPAIPHAIQVLQKMPLCIELIHDLVQINFPITQIIDSIPPGPARSYIQSIQFTQQARYQQAIDVLNQLPRTISISTQILINARQMKDWTMFDSISALIPMNEQSIIDLRAERLYDLHDEKSLTHLVRSALTDEYNSPKGWLAMTYYLQMRDELLRALQAVRKSIQIDPCYRRGHMRYGELRILNNDIQQAIEQFKEAHLLSNEIDSYRQLVLCYHDLHNSENAIALADDALVQYPSGHPFHYYALTLRGIAIEGIKPNESISIFQKVLSVDKKNTDALARLIELKLPEAEQILKQNWGPEEEFYLYKMGEIMIRKNNERPDRALLEQAQVYLNQALDINKFNFAAADLLSYVNKSLLDDDM